MQLAHELEGGAERTADVLGADAGAGAGEAVRFEALLLSARTLAGLRGAGFSRPSPVQLQAIPPGKCGFNLLMEAKSGTGKTAVFAVIALEMLDSQKDTQILILAPTREIAAQISDVIKQIGSKYEDLTVEVVMGGLPVKDDIEKFANKKKVNIIVGSPGRLRHLIENKHIDTSSVRLFVLDEADKLMEKSFQADINYIFSTLPNCKQVIMSSATYPEELKELVMKYMNKSLHIRPDTTTILLGISQKLTVVNQHSSIVVQTENRYKELIKIFKSRQFKQCLIFCNYQTRVVEICKKLKRDKWPAQFLHGKQEQTDRLDALRTLQEYKCRILVSTDLAARGIDASNVDLVINFEPPYEWTTYLHRIGRTGRYGSYGTAISIVAMGKELKDFKETLKAISRPLNMKDLWTDVEISLNDKNAVTTCQEKDVSTAVNMVTKFTNVADYKSDLLWDIINGSDEIGDQNEDEEKVIEAFDNLVASYEEGGVESFDELMTSFKNAKTDESEGEKIEFATIQVGKLFSKLCQSENVDLNGIGNNQSETNDDQDYDGKYNGDASNEYESYNRKPAKKVYNKKKPKNPPFLRSNTYTVPQNHKTKSKVVDFCPQNIESPETNYDDEPSSYNEDYKAYRYDNANKIINQSYTQENDGSLEETNCDDVSGCNHNSTKNRNETKRYSQLFSKYKKSVKHHKYKPKPQSDDEYTSTECSSYSENSTGSDSTNSQSDEEDVRWSLTSEEGKKLYKRLKKYEDQIKLSNQVIAARNYDIFKKQLAVRKAQIETIVYIQEMAKINHK